MKKWKVAIIVEKGFRQIAEFWEFNVRKMGYDFRIVNNMADARKFLGVLSVGSEASKNS